MTNRIKAALEHAQRQLADLLADRQNIDKQIMRWKRVVDSLAVVSEDVDTSIPADLELPASFFVRELRFTDAVRAIVERSQVGVTPMEVRDELIRIGFDLTKYKQQMVPVHNTLKRLEEQGEIYSVKTQPDTTIYRRIDPVAKALALDPPPTGRMVPLSSLLGAATPTNIGTKKRKFGDPPVNEDT